MPLERQETDFLRRRSFRRVVVAGPRAPAAVVDLLTQAADPVPADAIVLKPGDRCTVVRMDVSGRALVLKRYNLKGPLHTAVHLAMPSRAAWSWRNGLKLRQAGLDTPEPLACAEDRFGPLRRRSFLVTGFVEGTTLLDFVNGAPDGADLDRVAESFARAWRTLGRLRAGHDDMKATNFIVDADRRLWMIDLDGMRIGLPTPLFRRQRRQDLERFMRNWRDRPEAAAIFRARIDTA